MVFGWVMEEIEIVCEYGIEVEVIFGILLYSGMVVYY